MSDPQTQPPGDPNNHEPNAGQVPYGRQPRTGQSNGQPAETPYANPVLAAPLSDADDRLWGSLAHLGGILSFLPSLIIWLVFKDRGRFTNAEAKEALNFQITLVIGYVAINVASFILAIITFGIGGLLSGLAGLLWVIGVIFSIIGFLQAKPGYAGYRFRTYAAARAGLHVRAGPVLGRSFAKRGFLSMT